MALANVVGNMLVNILFNARRIMQGCDQFTFGNVNNDSHLARVKNQ
jgi:hypothetical protein